MQRASRVDCRSRNVLPSVVVQALSYFWRGLRYPIRSPQFQPHPSQAERVAFECPFNYGDTILNYATN
jgi:hypothetical protein